MFFSFLGWAALRNDPIAIEACEEIMDFMSRERYWEEFDFFSNDFVHSYYSCLLLIHLRYCRLMPIFSQKIPSILTTHVSYWYICVPFD